MKLTLSKFSFLLVGIIFVQPTVAQEKNKNILIADCVSGFMVMDRIYRPDPSKVSPISKKAFQKYSPQVRRLMEQVEAKCPTIDNDCVKNALKNNNDYEIANRLYGNFSFARQNADKMIMIGESACGKLD